MKKIMILIILLSGVVAMFCSFSSIFYWNTPDFPSFIVFFVIGLLIFAYAYKLSNTLQKKDRRWPIRPTYVQ